MGTVSQTREVIKRDMSPCTVVCNIIQCFTVFPSYTIMVPWRFNVPALHAIKAIANMAKWLNGRPINNIIAHLGSL